MASSKQVQAFYSLWFPTVLSFTRLYTGDDESAAHISIDAFCEYLHSGLPFDTDEMPLVLWECTVDVAQHYAVPGRATNRSEFENAVTRLHSEERLVFLLHALFALPPGWISLITGWSLARVQALSEASFVHMRDLLGFSKSVRPALLREYAAAHRNESR